MLITCVTSRGVHFEVATDLSTAIFLLAFCHFIALPVIMMSENASTYSSAADELTKLFTSEELNTVLGRELTRWMFISKQVPWFREYWERLIGLKKVAIKKTLGRAHINLTTLLQTVVSEVEAMLNDCPSHTFQMTLLTQNHLPRHTSCMGKGLLDCHMSVLALRTLGTQVTGKQTN